MARPLLRRPSAGLRGCCSRGRLRARHGVALLLGIALFAACQPAPTPPPPAAWRTPASNPAEQRSNQLQRAADLVDALARHGLAFDAEGQQEMEYLPTPAWIYRRGEQTLEVHEFPDATQATRTLARISPNGRVIRQEDGSRMAVEWLGSPHVYQAGRLLVIYVGSDEAVLAALETIMGPQRAGDRR